MKRVRISPLFCETGNNLSLGRVSFWIFTIFVIYYWIANKTDIPTNITIVYTSILAYNLFKKPIRYLDKIYNRSTN